MSRFTPEFIERAKANAEVVARLPTANQKARAIREAIGRCDVFFGIVRGTEQRVLIKGRRILEIIAAGKEGRSVVQGAIMVSCFEEAIAMRHAYGDGHTVARGH